VKKFTLSTVSLPYYSHAACHTQKN